MGERRVLQITAAFPPFHEDATCPKCGSDAIGTIHDANSHYCQKPWDTQLVRSQPGCCEEHLHRTCQRCHFGWREAVLPTT